MKKRTNGRGGALQYAATIKTETAAIMATIAAAQTKLYASSSKGAAAEWKENPVQPVAVLDEALNMGLHFLRLRYLGDDTGHPDDRVVSQSIVTDDSQRGRGAEKSNPREKVALERVRELPSRYQARLFDAVDRLTKTFALMAGKTQRRATAAP